MNDARDVFSHRPDLEISRFQAWRPKTLADVEEFIGARIVGVPNLSGTWFQLAICKKDLYELIGDVVSIFQNMK